MAGEATRRYVSEQLEASEWRWKALDVAVKIAMPILLGCVGWLANSHLDHESRLKVIEATRYTQRDAEQDRREMRDLLSEIKVQNATILQRLKTLEDRKETRRD